MSLPARFSLPLIACVALGCSEPVAPPPPPVKGADLIEVGGTVQLERSAPPPAPAGTVLTTDAGLGPLYVGDVVATQKESRAVIRCLDGPELELGELTRFRVGSRLGHAQLDLEDGLLTFLESDGGSLGTRFGQLSFPPGAKGTVDSRAGHFGVTLSLGTVTLLEEDGGTLTASPGRHLGLELGAVTIIEEQPPDAGPAAVPVVPVRFTAERGAPQLKAPGEPKFRSAAGPARELSEGTVFKVPAGARARLETSRIALQLPALATGSVGAASSGPSGESLAVDLQSGGATALFDGGEAELMLGSTAVQAQDAATVSVTRTRQGLALDVLAGEVTVSAGDQRQTASAGQRVLSNGKGDKRQLTTQERPRAPLSVPVDRRTSIYGATTQIALALPADPTRVEVAKDKDFTARVLVGVAKGPLTVPVNGNDTLFVRTLESRGGKVTQEGRLRFRPDRASPQAGARSDVISETGLRATLYFQSEVPALTFSFAGRSDAKRYRLKIFKSEDLKKPVIEREVTTTSCTLEAGALPEGSYVWYAAALDTAGGELGDGATNRFDLQFDNELTSLTIARPVVGEARSATTQASGVAPLKTRLFVNGRPAPLDPRGRFSVTVGAVDSVVFRLVAADGSESYWVRKLGR